MDQLILILNNDAPEHTQQAWRKMREIVLDDTNAFFTQVKDRTKLEINTNMVVLDRAEGGLGDKQVNDGRQIRLNDEDFCDIGTYHFDEEYFGKFGNIRFVLFSDDFATWNEDQILDISKSIIRVGNIIMSETTNYHDNGLSVFRISKID